MSITTTDLLMRVDRLECMMSKQVSGSDIASEDYAEVFFKLEKSSLRGNQKSYNNRAPEWAQTLLENWLLNLKNKRDNPRDRLQKLSSLKRAKATIERNLASASLSGVSTDIAIAGMKIDSAEKLLTPKSYAKDKQ